MLSSKFLNILKNNFKILKQFSMQYLKENPYFDKYSDKINNLKNKDSKTYEDRLNAFEKIKKEEKKQIELTTSSRKHVHNQEDNLNSIVNLEIFTSLDGNEISDLWKEYHKNKDCVFATLSADDFNIIYEKSKEYPNFIYPLPRGSGYEFFLQKWLGNVCHFTSLCEFKELNENAHPSVSLHHYRELAENKDTVLMRGFPDLKKISVHESQLLALQLKMYYGRTSALRFNLVRIFNNSPSDFNHMHLIQEFENLKKDTIEKREWGTPVD